jgi:hypothetical protein
MVTNRISTLEICGESEALYIPEWTTADPKLVSLDLEGREEDARVMHNLHVLEKLSKSSKKDFFKEIEIFERGFRFRPSSKLFREDTGETIYITGDENDSLRFLFYARPEGIQPEIPFGEEDLLNMERPLPVTQVEKIEVIMHDHYSSSLAGLLVEQDFPEIKFPVEIIRNIGMNRFHDCPTSYGLPGLWLSEFWLEGIEFTGKISATGAGYSPEGRFYGNKEGYVKTLREMGRLTSEEGSLTLSGFFLKVEENREEGIGTTTLRISL